MADDNENGPESDKQDEGESASSVVITKPAPVSEPAGPLSDDTVTTEPTNQNPLMSYFEEGETEDTSEDRGDQEIVEVVDDSSPSGEPRPQESGVGELAKDPPVIEGIHDTVGQEGLKSEQSASVDRNVLVPDMTQPTKDESKEGTCQKGTSEGGDTQTSEASEASNASKPTIATLPPLPPPPPPPRSLSKKRNSKPRARGGICISTSGP